MTRRLARAALTAEHTKLLERADELLDESRSTDVAEGYVFKRDALDFLNRMGLGANPVYREVDQANFNPPLPAGPSQRTIFEKNFYGVLAFIKSRLELARHLVRKRQTRPPKHGRRVRYPAVQAASRTRARTVARLRQELKRFPPHSDADRYEQLKKENPDFLVFHIAESCGKEAKDAVMNLPVKTSHTPYNKTAIELAALYHGKAVATIRQDWKHRKSRLDR